MDRGQTPHSQHTMNKTLRNTLIGTAAIAACVFGTKAHAGVRYNWDNIGQGSSGKTFWTRVTNRSHNHVTIQMKTTGSDYAFYTRVSCGTGRFSDVDNDGKTLLGSWEDLMPGTMIAVAADRYCF